MTESVAQYREAMRALAGMRNLDVWYYRIDFERVLAEVRDRLDPAAVKRLRRNREKAERKDSMRAFAKLTRIVDGQPRSSATRR